MSKLLFQEHWRRFEAPYQQSLLPQLNSDSALKFSFAYPVLSLDARVQPYNRDVVIWLDEQLLTTLV